MRLRILCLTPWFPNAPGMREGNYIYDSVVAVRAEDVSVNVLLARAWKPWPQTEPTYSSFLPDLELQLLRYPSIPRDFFSGLSNRMRFVALLNRVVSYGIRHKVQLIHAQTEAFAEVASVAAQVLGIPSVVTIHGVNTSHRYLGTTGQRAYFRRALRACDNVVLVGEPIREFFVEIAGADTNFTVIHNGYSLLPISRRTKILVNPKIHFVSVSNLHEGKGIDLTLAALVRLRASGIKNWTYTIVGDGDQRNALERLVDEYKLAPLVRFAGAVEHAAVSPYLSEADIFVLPSYREAFGVAYLEAMASGLLAIGVEGQGAAEFIRHGENGLLAKPKNSDDLADQLRFAIENPDVARSFAEAGKKTAEEDFTWPRHAKALHGLYRDLVQEVN